MSAWIAFAAGVGGAVIGAAASIVSATISNRHAARLARDEQQTRLRLAQRSEVVSACRSLSHAAFTAREAVDRIESEAAPAAYERLELAMTEAALFASPSVMNRADNVRSALAAWLHVSQNIDRTIADGEAAKALDGYEVAAHQDRLDRFVEQRRKAADDFEVAHDLLIVDLRSTIADFSRTDAPK